MSVHRPSSDPFRSGTAGRGKAKPTWDAASSAYSLAADSDRFGRDSPDGPRNFALSVTDAHTFILIYTGRTPRYGYSVCHACSSLGVGDVLAAWIDRSGVSTACRERPVNVT